MVAREIFMLRVTRNLSEYVLQKHLFQYFYKHKQVIHVSKVHNSPVKWTPWRSPLLQPNFGLKMVIVAFAFLFQNTVFLQLSSISYRDRLHMLKFASISSFRTSSARRFLIFSRSLGYMCSLVYFLQMEIASMFDHS